MNLLINRRILYVIGGVFTGVVLLLAGILWWHQPRHRVGRTDISPFENDMIESFVRSLLREDGVRNAPVCFLSFDEGGTSPSSSFLARFADCHQPAVRSVDRSVSPPNNRFFEKDNGRSGLIIQIIKFKEFVPDVFDITVSISNLPRGHDQIVYRISRSTGEWTITKRTPI